MHTLKSSRYWTETPTLIPSETPTSFEDKTPSSKDKNLVSDDLIAVKSDEIESPFQCVSRWLQGVLLSDLLDSFGWFYFEYADYPYMMALDCDLNTLTCSKLYWIVDPNSDSLPPEWLVIPEQTENSCTTVDEPSQGYWVEIEFSE